MDTSIILRYGPILDVYEIANLQINVQGAQSGAHSGETILADDHMTVVFKPDQRTKTAFETQSYLAYLPSNVCYFQAAALDKNGNELSRSAIISTNPTECPSLP